MMLKVSLFDHTVQLEYMFWHVFGLQKVSSASRAHFVLFECVGEFNCDCVSDVWMWFRSAVQGKSQ